jgi:hypothetical protein
MEMAVVMERLRRSSIFFSKSFCLKSLLVALTVGGCAMADSTIVDRHVQYTPGSVVCSSTLGSYALPKSFIHVVIGRSGNTPPDLVTTLDALPDGKFNFDIVRRADPALTICLDYLASVFSHDEITVTKQSIDLKNDGSKVDDGTSATTSRQFLRSVIVNASDRSVQIARNLMQAAFVSLSGNPDFGPARKVLLPTDKAAILADLEFDPFDARDSAEANARLSRLGFCLVLEGFTYDRGSLSVDQYCNSPYRVRDHIPRIAELYAVKSREPIAPNTPGVMYRPRQTYMISVYQRNASRGGAWHLSRRVDVDLENLSPVISVGISRAIFARRNAALMFENGVLNTVCIAKTSEIENFVAIPFEISRSLVALPSQIVKVRINRIAQEEQLARVENLYIQTQAALLKTLAGQQVQKPTGDTSAATPVDLKDPIFNDPALAADANTFTIDDTDTKTWINNKCGAQLILNPATPNQ